ncbi:MAG: pilin [Methylophaga sp.]|nr:pilin [Methylophaga sp.]
MSKKWLIAVLVIVILVVTWNHEKRQAINAAMLTQGFEVSTLLRFASKEYFDGMGELPSSNAQLGMGAPEDYSNLALHSASIIEGGTIELVYKVNTGIEGGIIRYVPTIVPGMIKWSCETPDYVDIADYFLCEYVPVVEGG